VIREQDCSGSTQLNSGIGIDNLFQFWFRNWNCLLKKMELELINLELKFATKWLNSQINLPINFLIQEYFFHDNPTWNIHYSEYRRSRPLSRDFVSTFWPLFWGVGLMAGAISVSRNPVIRWNILCFSSHLSHWLHIRFIECLITPLI